MNSQSRYPLIKGFSLVELSMVLFILGLMLQMNIEPIAGRLENRRRSESLDQLKLVQQHLRAHWVSYGFLPCPLPLVATENSPAISPIQSGGVCLDGVGYVPANTLSIIGPLDDQGALLDPWGRALRYHVSMSDVNQVTQPNTPDWVTAGELSSNLFTELNADLTVCRLVTELRCERADQAAADIVAVVVSQGSNDSAREAGNRDADRQFVSAAYSMSGDYAFDDQLVWLGRSELILLALESGWLP